MDKICSSGGDAFSGLCIARKMRQNDFEEVIVDGICVSSCANYLFLAARQRRIKNGFVGYHGNVAAVLKHDPTNSQIRDELKSAEINSKEIGKITANFAKEMQENSKLESEFLKDIGVSQSLFDRTQTPDKGEGDGGTYEFLLPTQKTFEFYGIKNVVGEQNFKLGELLGLTNILK